tara:strand:+ start:366 stop:602 length:237 start_codon:yes stop_codon:yes gene_type:complete
MPDSEHRRIFAFGEVEPLSRESTHREEDLIKSAFEERSLLSLKDCKSRHSRELDHGVKDEPIAERREPDTTRFDDEIT